MTHHAHHHQHNDGGKEDQDGVHGGNEVGTTTLNELVETKPSKDKHEGGIWMGGGGGGGEEELLRERGEGRGELIRERGA